MNNKRLILSVLCFLLLAFSLYGEHLQTVKTAYFDIIYTETSAPSAALLAEYADGYAEEICAALHKKMKKRMPVYLVPDTEELNGYFTTMPYRRIVLYDTAAGDGALGNFTDTVLQVFYHELTHAVSLESPLLGLLPMSFTEGAAVSFESLYGQGRLHDPLMKQYLIQNKIEGLTPLWQEAAGARDMYPGGLWPYMYGGFFADYLQKTYGMETYAKLWQPSWRLFILGKFKSVYQKDLRKAWNQFVNSIPLPETLTEPVPFNGQTEKSGYAVTAPHPEGFAYYDFNRQAVYFTPAGTNGPTAAPVKLFTAGYSVSHLSFSEDGRLLLVSDSIETSSKTVRKRTRVFDMESRCFTGQPLFSSLAACFADSGRTLAAIMLNNQDFSLVLVDRISGSVKKTLYTAGPGKTFAALYSPCRIGGGKIAFIGANGVRRTIVFADTETGALSALPQNETPYALRYLQSVNSGGRLVLSFSWAEMNMLYRLGLYYPESGELKVQHTDVSGGVFFPAVLPSGTDTQPHTIVYAGQHGTYHCLYTMSEEELNSKTVLPAVLLPAGQPLSDQQGEDAVTGAAGFAGMSKQPKTELLRPGPYRPSEWLWRAKVLPAFSMPADIKKAGGYGFGLKFSMLDPAEKIQLTPSFMLFAKPFFAQGAFTAVFHFRPLSFSVGVSDELEAKTFSLRKTALTGGIGCYIPLSYSWESLELSYKGSANWISLLSDKAKTYYSIPYRYTVLAHEGILQYRNLRSTHIVSEPFFAKQTKGGFVSGAAAHAYCVETNTNAAVFQTQAGCFLPVVPIRFTFSAYLGIHAKQNPFNGTYSHIVASFPVTATNYFPVFDVYAADSLRKKSIGRQTGTLSGGFSGICDITVFSYEVQRGGAFTPLFLNRFAVHTGYTGAVFGSLSTKKTGLSPLYLDTAYLNLVFTFNRTAYLQVEYVHPLRTPLKSGKAGVSFSADL